MIPLVLMLKQDMKTLSIFKHTYIRKFDSSNIIGNFLDPSMHILFPLYQFDSMQ